MAVLPVAFSDPASSVNCQIIGYDPGEAPAGTRHIMMWADEARQKSMVKYIAVPDQYDLADVKHADFLGMFQTFNNGETWQTINGKRLFHAPPWDGHSQPGPEAVEDWPVMGPEELRLFLAKEAPYAVLAARWHASQEADATRAPQHDRRSYMAGDCSHAGDCCLGRGTCCVSSKDCYDGYDDIVSSN